MNDDLTLIVGEAVLSGWRSVRVTRGIERCPSDFEIALTERYPGEADAFVVQAGYPCRVMLGSDLVITGYVDRFTASITQGQHTVTVVGRGKCADLVDCSAEWPGGQISGSNALGIARNLAAPYGIRVIAICDIGVLIQQFNLLHGESPFEIIERVCRYSSLLAYESPEGNLLLAQAGDGSAASGFTQGVNVQEASFTVSQDQKFSEYLCYQQSMDVLGDLGEAGNLQAIAKDASVLRHRRRDIVSEAPVGGHDFAQRRVTWEANRRSGRAAVLRVVADSWRDSAGALWQPNLLVPISIPQIKCDKKTWLISEVTYRRDENGTTADLIIMPPLAFSPIPAIQLPTLADIPLNPGVPSP
jgi:prophage tail gpP-like protein